MSMTMSSNRIVLKVTLKYKELGLNVCCAFLYTALLSILCVVGLFDINVSRVIQIKSSFVLKVIL